MNIVPAIIIATGVMGLAIFMVAAFVETLSPPTSWWGDLADRVSMVGAGMVIFAFAAALILAAVAVLVAGVSP